MAWLCARIMALHSRYFHPDEVFFTDQETITFSFMGLANLTFNIWQFGLWIENEKADAFQRLTSFLSKFNNLRIRCFFFGGPFSPLKIHNTP